MAKVSTCSLMDFSRKLNAPCFIGDTAAWILPALPSTIVGRKMQGPQPCLRLLAISSMDQYAASSQFGPGIVKSITATVCDRLKTF